MGIFDSLKNLLSRSDKKKPKKKAATKKAGKKAASKRKQAAKGEKSGKGVKPSAKKKSAASKKKVIKKTKTKEAPAKMPFSLGGKSKKRKKAKQVKADPINENALGFSISLKGEDEHAKKRNAVRIRVDGLTVHIPRLQKQFPVTDISATGLGFDFAKPRVKSGVKLTMDILLNGEKKATAIECKVMRHERGSVGCVFTELDRAQDDAVHEIVLLGQKQQSDRKNALKDLEFKLPD